MCDHPGTNHSNDRVTVWHGRTTPLALCGYHASRLNADMFKELHNA